MSAESQLQATLILLDAIEKLLVRQLDENPLPTVDRLLPIIELRSRLLGLLPPAEDQS
jgi:hypothetical protein